MAEETVQNNIKSILVNFRKKDRKLILRKLRKSIREIKKELKNK